MRRGKIVVGLVLLLVVSQAAVFAGEFNPTLSIGDAAPAWKDLPGVDGKKHSLAALAKYDAVVVVFTCNSCPVAADYEDRILDLASKFKVPNDRVAMVAINVNKIPEDSLEEMAKRAKEKDFSFPYLYDETQQIAKDYGATFTPEFFVLDKERKIAYMGGMDNNSSADKATEHYVTPAVEAVLAGQKPEIGEKVAIGCLIRYQQDLRGRRKK